MKVKCIWQKDNIWGCRWPESGEVRYRWKRRGRNQKGLQGWSTKQSSDRAQRFRFWSYKVTILSVVRGHPEFPRPLQGFCKVKIIILVVLRHYFPFSLYIHPDTKTRVGKTAATLAVHQTVLVVIVFFTAMHST